MVRADKEFKGTITYPASSASTLSVYATCDNRLLMPVTSNTIAIELKEVPEAMANFSLQLSNDIIQVGYSTDLLIIFTQGNQMSCNITSSTANIFGQFSYSELVARQETYSSAGKAYRIGILTTVFSLQHQVHVLCRNLLNEFKGNVTLQAQEPITGLASGIPSLLCYNDTLDVSVTAAQGRPVYKSLFINFTKYADFYSVDGSSNSFSADSSMYGDPGWKEVKVRAWNNVSNSESTGVVRIARNVTSLSVIANFTMSSPQALTRRPANHLPVRERIDFSAIVVPFDNGYFYNWSINVNLTSASTTTPNWSYTFLNAGTYLLTVVVDGCNNFVYHNYFTVLEPVEDFQVIINPYPVALVNSQVSINITIPSNSECMELYFGTGNETLSRCRNDTFYGFLCTFATASCQKSVKFTASGNYSLNFTATNGLYARVKTVDLMAKACQSPKIQIEGNGKKTGFYLGSPIDELYRSSGAIYTLIHVNVTCELSDIFAVEWKVYSPWTGSKEPRLLIPASKIQMENENKTMKIPCCVLNYGLMLVNVTVAMTGSELINGLIKSSAHQSAYVNDTNIQAFLKENGNYSYRYNSTISLNATDSYDPDNFTKTLTVTWFCRDTVLESRDIFSIPSLPVINSTFFLPKIDATASKNASLENNSSHISNSSIATNGSDASTNGTEIKPNEPTIGCFGQPYGRLNVSNTTKLITFNSANLQENHTIEFIVVVEGASPLRLRRSPARRSIFVKSRETPYFEIRCVENCAMKADPRGKLTLKVSCKSESCEKRAIFKWSLRENGHLIGLADKIHSSIIEKDLYMKPNSIKKGLNYALILRGTAYDGAIYEQVYHFIANEPPSNGNCSLAPSSGIAIETKFRMNCTGWVDTDLPLLYELAYFTDVLTTVVCRKKESFCDSSFPVGDGTNSSLNIRIRVFDKFGMFSELYHNVKVTAPKLSLRQMDHYMSEIVNGTNDEIVTQLIGAVGSVLNSQSDDNMTNEYLEKSIKFREASISVLSRLVNRSSDDVIAPLIAIIAEKANQFSQKSAKIATNSMIEMTGEFVNDQLNIIFRDLVDRGKSLLAAIGMVTKSASKNLDPKRIRMNETTSTDYLLWEKNVGRLLVLNMSFNFDNISSVLFSRMSPFDGEVSIPTANLGLVLKKSFTSHWNETSSLSMMNNEIILPSLADMHINDNYIVSSLMKVTTFNSYFWDETSRLTNSTVTMFELKADETPLVVRNTKEPIELKIKRNFERPIPFQHWRFQQRANQERINYHKLEVTNDNSLHIELKPMNYCIDYHIFIKRNSRPSRDDYYKNWTLPDLSTCNSTGLQEEIKANICAIYRELVSPSLRYQVNASQQHINCSIMEALQKRIKDALKLCKSDPFRIYLTDTESKNGIYYLRVSEASGGVFQETTPPLLYNSSYACQVADIIGESSYFLRSYTTKCRYWAPSEIEEWQTKGCYVGAGTDPGLIHCKCNHLTSFAADFFMAPNPIDIDKVIKGFKNIEDNLSVVILISLLCGFYLMLVVYLRRLDKRDAGKVNVTVMDNDSSKPYEYLIIFVTGARFNAGTTAHVFCCLNSETKLGEARLLFDPEKPLFQRDQINAFKVSFAEPIGDVTDIRLWHDNAGDSPGWFLSRIYVEDLQTNKRSLFICERWFAVELEEGLIDRIVPVASYDDQKLFSHLFTTKAAKDFSDEHIWLSVALKRAHDTFTRVQRLTCCMSLLFTTMLASAMFFQLGNNSKYIWKIGSLEIDYKGIIIGVQSGFVVIPVNIAIAFIFRHSESFEMYWKRRERGKHTGCKTKRKMLLPCGCIIISWFLAISSILASLIIVLFYSMQWGNERSQQFVISVLTSFLQSAFLIQPFKLVFVALVLALILKKGTDETEILERYKYSADEREIGHVPFEIDLSQLQTSPLSEKQLKYARKRRRMEIRLKLFLQDLLSYLVFLTFLALVVRGYRDPNEFYFRQSLEEDILHKHFQSLQDIPGLWTWVQHHFIPAIYTQQWYNGENFTNFKMLQNQEAYRIGLARIRQLRIKTGTCKVYNEMSRYFNSCDGFYSLNSNEERDFNVAWKLSASSRRRRSVLEEFTKDGNDSVKGDKPRYDSEVLPNYFVDDYDNSDKILKRSRRALKFKIKRKTIPSTSSLSHPDAVTIDERYLLPNGLIKPNKDNWIYHDMSSLRGFPYYGHFATYSGGGYVASLSTDIDYARATAMALEQDSWVDMLTRAIFFEFSVYNANLNFFATGFIIVEVLPTGSIVPSANIRVFKLYRYVGLFGRVVMASEIILVLCLLFFIYKECRHMYRLGCAYFKLFWSWVEIIIAIALFTAIILRAFSWYEADKNLMKLRQSTEQFINFHYTVVADDALLLSVAIICFASTIKIVKLLAIFPTFVLLKETIYRFAKPLFNYTLPFCIAFFGFATLAYLLFHTEALFSTYIKSCQTQLLMLIGGSVYYTLKQAHEILGPLFFLMFATFETCILLNIFLTIINDSIKESAAWKSEARSNDFVDFIEDRIRAILLMRPAERKPSRRTRKSSSRISKTSKSIIHHEAATASPSNPAACCKITSKLSKRRVTFCETVIPGLKIRKSSIRKIFGLNYRNAAREMPYAVEKGEEPELHGVIIVKAADECENRNTAEVRQDSIGINELDANKKDGKRKRNKELKKFKMNLNLLEEWINKSIEDEHNETKFDLKIFSLYY